MENHKSDSAELKPSFQKAVKIFEKVIDDEAVAPQQLQVAMSVAKAYTKSRAVENQRALLVYQVARDYSEDKQELRAILEGSIPNIKFISEPNGKTT